MIRSYCYIRFTPYAETGEFVNVGKVIFSHDDNSFDFALDNCSERVNHFFPKLEEDYFDSWLEAIKEEMEYIKQQNHITSTDAFKSLIKPIESNLQYSAPRTQKYSNSLIIQKELDYK